MKKFLAIILVGLMVLSLGACGGKGDGGSDGPSITLTQVLDEDDTVSATATVGYGELKHDGSSLTEEDEALLIHEEKGYELELYLYFDDDYEGFKEDAKNEGNGYKDVKYSGYEGYMYEYGPEEYEVCLLLNQVDEENGVYLFVYVQKETYEGEMEELFNEKGVQDVLNSIKIN